MTQASTLPARAGTRPHTTSELPHSQLDQQPADSRYVDDILTEALTWTSVQQAPSRISVEGARALTVDSDAAAGPVEAFLVGQEFCHVHAQGDYSLHATLPLELATAAERAGWAEPHYLVHSGRAPATVVMLTPRVTPSNGTSSCDSSAHRMSSRARLGTNRTRTGTTPTALVLSRRQP